jgi:O-antigen/teichoic acid export membrane protein
LLLSAFSYPLSALLINILSSRGKSKTFLKLEILKKAVQSLNFVNAIYFGIDSYLYGLVITAFINVSLNIIFAAKEIELNVLDFYKPIAIQMILCISCVYCTLIIANMFESGFLVGFFLKGSLFVALFTALNIAFKTKSFNVVFEQIAPVIKNKIKKNNTKL